MKTLYFYISYPRNKKENPDDIDFVIPEDKKNIPKCIFVDEIYKDKIYYYKKIFMVNKSTTKGKKANNYHFEFELEDDKYIITFDSKGASFVYDVKLEKTKRMIQIIRKINQNVIEYYDKMHIFKDALKENNIENANDSLYLDTIDLFSTKKGFAFLIELFIEIYKNKEVCTKLLQKFKEMNESQKDNEKIMDRKPFLGKHISMFNTIITESENYNYDTIEFYGVILCYLNFYDKENFSKVIKELFKKKPKELYEILLIYNSHFINPIKQNFDFFNKFIEYTILNKNYDFFERGLNYVRDIETFLNIIDKNKEKFFEKYIKDNKDYLKHIIKLDKNLKNIKAEIINENNTESAQKSNEESSSSEMKIKIADGKENNSDTKNKSLEDYAKENNNKIKKKQKNQFIFNIIKDIKSLIDFSKTNKIFLIYFTNNFWKYILNYFNEPNQDNIYICFQLREIFIKYYNLVNEIFKDKDKKFTIKSDASNYYDLDEFAFLLDQIIKRFIINNKDLKNIEKLSFITQYNPYYIDKKSINKDINIFDLFDLSNIDIEFIEDFRKMNFELIFKENISEYINKIISKIKVVSDFDNVIKLINITNIEDKSKFLSSLVKTYDKIIKNEIEKKLVNYQILARLSIIFFNYENEKNKFKFIESKIKKLDENIIPKIFIEIMRIYINKKDTNKEDDEEKDIDEKVENFDLMKDYILEQFIKLKEEKDIENIMSLIDCLAGTFNETNDKKKEENKEIINEFLNKLLDEKNIFKKEEFFSSKENLKIILLSKLNEKRMLQKNDSSNYYGNLEELMGEIKKDLDGEIKKKTFDEFLNNKESIIKQRLSLLNIIYDNYKANDEYNKLKGISQQINNDIDKLIAIKDNIIIYHRETYKDKIKQLMNLIKNNQNKQIKEYKTGRIKEFIKELEGLESTIETVKKVKNNLLFNVIYESMNIGRNEETGFEKAVEKLDDIGELLKKETDINNLYNNKEYKNIFDTIKEKLSTNEQRAQEFIEIMKQYYNITNENLINDLTILFKIKKYEMDINSIIFFFEFFQRENKKWNDRLDKKTFLDLFSKKKMENDKNNENGFTKIKAYLNKLKKDVKKDVKNDELYKEYEIYDYENIKNYNKLFACLYDKKEAIDFLFSKIGQNIQNLYDRIQPTDRTISITDIHNTEECISVFSKMKKLEDNFKIFDYIKNMNGNMISRFENYSRIYLSVIELDTFYDDSENLYGEVNDIIKDKTFNIYQDKDDFNLEDLTHLKNKIHIKNEKIDETKIKTSTSEEKQLKLKCKILIFFKNLISNLEIINEYMKVLRSKGSSLPIKISIQTKIKDFEPTIEYYLDGKVNNFEDIRNFLFNAKNTYIAQLNTLYIEKMNIRFLYGKQFRSIMKHLESDLNIDPFLRYITNNKDNNKAIKEGFKAIKRNAKDYINQHELYNKNSLESISTYITSVFTNNSIKIEDHYNKMEIFIKPHIRKKSNSITTNTILLKEDLQINNNCKGIYLHECENNTMERYILNLYWDKLAELPIAQNVLIANKETSPEEIQAFFHRAILCNYNVLFVVGINDTFSDYQQSIMNSYISDLLSEKYKNFKVQTNEDVDKKMTSKYLDSCIVFIYEKKNNNITSFLNEIKKYEEQDIFCNDEIDIKKADLENIKVITSDICGLGKSEKIKKKIKDKKNYFHFPLGGILSKDIIFHKLKNLLNKIKREREKENYKDITIHLDLTESEEISIINEFFFSFLITKFYINNESIIYIPKDISIYIEVPNCFENYLSKFGLLSIFNKENISLKSMPPFDYSKEMIEIFKRMLEINSNDGIQKFVSKFFKKINIENYSYHQINIFIKLFISQYNKFKSKLIFLLDEEDVTEQCIEDFSKSTKYFTNGGFAKLLTGSDNINKEGKDSIDILSEIYENDLAGMTFPDPLIFIIKEKMTYDKLYIPTKNTKSAEKYKNSKDYLQRIKEALDLPNEVEKDIEKDGNKYKSLLSIIEESNYVITIDNFKKMVLLVYRIKANVPVILMGETGCGKTALITKLNQILNNGEITVEIINIHPGITDEKLSEFMVGIDKKAENKKDQELWVFFDEMNTCLSLSLLTEIFINRTYNGNRLSDNIRLIGACNPYRRRKGNKEKCGISISNDNKKELVYLVQPLPQSLLYYVFSFGRIDDIDEKKYIHSIIEKLFSKDEEKLYEATTEAISECHKYLRNTYDASVVSLREIARFSKSMQFFQKYFAIKNKYEERNNNEKNNKIRSIICSIYICYYIRLTNDIIRNNFDNILRTKLLNVINNKKNNEINAKINEENKGGNLIDQIKDENFRKEISDRPSEIINYFSDFLKIEQDYVLNKIELDKGIGKNTLLKENVFLLFLSVITNIPLIIIGKPGTGKSLSAQLINKSMKGIYSKNKFFKEFPKIIQTYFQGSESTQPVDVENVFDKAKNKLTHYKNNKLELPISMILFDELGLAESSKSNPLKVLHSKLEYSGKDEGVSFVGISNYSLDAAKVNRALILSVPDLDSRLDELIETSYNIVESISDKLKKDKIFDILSKTYFKYKYLLDIIKELTVYKLYKSEKDLPKDIPGEITPTHSSNVNNNEDELDMPKKKEKSQFEFIKETEKFKDLYRKENKIRRDFHGNRDFYNLIKGIAIEFGKLGNDSDENDKLQIIEKYIERNFGGIDYDIDIDFNLNLEDIKGEIEIIKNILKDYTGPNKKKLNSVYIFKKLYCLELEKEDPNSKLIIKKENLNNYNLNNCINDNIGDVNSRFLLLEVKKSLTTVICQNIKLQNPFKEKIIIYDGSPFADDDNKEYRFKILNQIQENLREDCLIILENLDQIHPFLFDLYNMNYLIKDEKKFARICLEDKFNDQLTEVNSRLRIIVLVDKRFVDKVNLAFLNRFEKINLSFDKLLDKDLKLLAHGLLGEMSLKKTIKNCEEDINYSLKDLLINCGEEEIQGLIYYFYNKSKKKENNNDNVADNQNSKELLENIKENVYNKIYKILPQDIIFLLPEKNIIKNKYLENKNLYNLKDYISKEDNKKYKISIIYTFTGIANIVEGLDNEMNFMISKVSSEDALKNLIDEMIIKKENNKLKKDYNNIIIHFDLSYSKKIKYISNFILKNFKNDKYNYIFIVHINRNFKKKKNEKIYSLSDINDDINQMFIDNLNGNNAIAIKDLIGNNIKDIIDSNKESMKLNEEFNIILTNYLLEKLKETSFSEDIVNCYINEIQNYMEDESEFKEKIIEKTIKFIEEKLKEEKEEDNMIENILKNINIYDIDVVSCILEYIKNNVFNKYLKYIFEILENNNILTTLLEIRRNNNKYIKNDIVEKILNKYLEEITIEKNKKYEPKFLFNYNLPGFYEFYVNISDYINKNISINFFTNEKKIRDLLKITFEKINNFHDLEESSLTRVGEEIKKNTFIFYFINEIDKNIILEDYITYYLQKYKNKDEIYKNNDIYHKLIELLLKLRFDDKKIIKDNKNNQINILLIKIIWIESNINYISNILKIAEFALEIFNNDENKLYKEIEESLTKNNIKYITNDNRNPEHTKEVNECYYLLLASICYSITSDEIKLNNQVKNNEIEIHLYYSKLKEINKILQFLNSDLYIYLNEMYIIDELIKIIELLKYNIEKINEIKKYIRENALILQKYAYNDSEESNQKTDRSEEFIEELNDNFDKIYDLIKEEKEEKADNDYYDKLGYILFKEIKKISNSNYRYHLFEKLIEQNQIIKKSNEIFQMLLKNYLKKDRYEDAINLLLNGNDEILKLIENKLNDDTFVLRETLLYFFEKNSLIYLKTILNNENKKKQNMEDGPLKILDECIKFLNYYISKPDTVKSKKKEICKLFCLGYIKTYCYTFIKMFDDEKPKYKDPIKIIEAINGNNPIHKMIRIYIYKILYNNYNINVFINEASIEKYKLKKYKDFDTLIKKDELININKIDYEVKTLKFDLYDESYKKLKKHINTTKKLTKKDLDVEEIGIDNFYIVSYILILSDLKNEQYSPDINKNFYNNICKPLFTNNNLLLKAMELLYDPKKYEDIKRKYKINSDNIIPLLYGYRYVLNELSTKNENSIYYPIYNRSNFEYLKNKLYPGNDTKYNKAYSNIINHFKSKPNEGCYICLCKDWYYHSVPSGFPGSEEINKKCPYCKKAIGSEKKGSDIVIVKRDNYLRIYKDDKEISKYKKNMLSKINYCTLDEFKKNNIYNSQKNEKGVFMTDKNSFKNDNKIIRDLSQVSYRLLNYILYIHLFFARIITDKREFENYLPRGMNFVETLYECWILLKNELSKERIYSIDKFMNYIFPDIFPILNKKECINDYDKLIEFENNLELLIKEKIKKYKEEKIKYYSSKKNNEESSLFNLLKEKYTKEHYNETEFPFYEYFYYSDYLNERYISEKLEHMDENKYPVLKNYLNNLNTKKKEKQNNYSLNNLNLFNNVLNLYFEKYSNHVSREFAEKKVIKEDDLYIKNNELIESFFKFYNNLEIKDHNNETIKLSNDNHLIDLFITDREIGKSYKNIYKRFVKEQNDKIESLLDNKIQNGIFDINYRNKVNVQNITEKEIFTNKLPEKISFIDILFNSSYRKIIDNDNGNYESYKEYEINYNFIEEIMTENLLKNKKLLNDDINEIIYNNEVFSNEVSNFITLFNKRYFCKSIDNNDKISIYKFSMNNNSSFCKEMINDFIILIKFLNDQRKEGNDNDIKEETKIYNVIDKLKNRVSDNFIKIFERNEGLTIDKTSNIFQYYLKTIYEEVNNEIKKYQQDLNNESKEIIKEIYQKSPTIKKKDFASAIRLFTTLVLFLEEDKEKKIKTNRNNVLNYLKVPDLWSLEIYEDQDFNKNLIELKSINATINQIIYLYEYLGKDIENNYFDGVKQEIENLEKANSHEPEEPEEPEEHEENNGHDDDDDPFAPKDGDDFDPNERDD